MIIFAQVQSQTEIQTCEREREKMHTPPQNHIFNFVKIFLFSEFLLFKAYSLLRISYINLMKTKEGDRLTLMKIMMLLGLSICSVSEIIKEGGFSLSQEAQSQPLASHRNCFGILGCILCGEDGQCLECGESTVLYSSFNQCFCITGGTQLNVEGNCVNCIASDCRVCGPGSTYSTVSTCEVCYDDTAGPVDGKCICPGGQFMHFGRCQDCPVPLTNGQCVLCEDPGCGNCENSVCTNCKDVYSAKVNQNGKCECILSSESFNVDGFCSECKAKGCKLCDSHPSECFQCVDPNATPNSDGKCGCKQGQSLNESGFCGPCDAEDILWIDGICHPPCQSVRGCSTCNQNGVCIQCNLDLTMKIDDGVCLCRFTGWEINVEGLCGSCEAPGCKLCGPMDEYQHILNCAECDDGLTLVDGKCRCPTGQLLVGEVCEECPVSLNDDGQCVPCSLQGCLLCSDGVTCEKCIDKNAELKDGQCVCSYEVWSLNVQGSCTFCEAIGCRTCEADIFKSYRCAECIDPNSTPNSDGKCTCPDGEGLQDDGYCHPCQALGCEFCIEGNPDACSKCIGAPAASINDEGKCECLKNADQKPNSEGICEECFVEGCLSCVAGSPYTCSICADESNTDIIGGQCICKTGVGMNDAGYCQQCSVAGCASCQTGNNAVCERCVPGFYLEDGRCECNSPSNKINQHGLCSTCSIPGCKSCLAADASQCLSCYDGAKLVQNSCLCGNSGEAPNEKGKCSDCFVAGCLSCSSQNPYYCLSCSANFNLQNGICSCPNSGQKINLAGECEACHVEGCQSCETGNPNTCAKCFDCDAYLIDGQCSCPDEQIWSSSLNSCSSQATIAQFSTSLQSQKECPEHCSACEDGQCSKCSEGFYLKQFDNQCIECNPRCKSCVDGLSCEVHRQGWTTEKGKIKHCDVLHCAECPERVGKCQKCKQNYVLVSELKCEFSPENPEVHEDNGNFSEFKRKYNKNYASEEEEKFRESIYQARYEEIQDLSKILPFQVGENKFADQTEKEANSRPAPQLPQKRRKSSGKQGSLISGFPTSLNWTERGAVTSVKNQAECGSCWAFAAAAASQSALIMMKRATVNIDLSQQYLLECSLESGCDGTGNMDQVMNITLRGVPTEQSHPYDPKNLHPGICEEQDKQFISHSYSHYYGLSEEEVIAELQNGPMLTHLSTETWRSYEGGVFQCPQSAIINHVALLVGYTENAWIVKNQWKEDWGENGYIRITRSKNHDCSAVEGLIRHDLKFCEAAGCMQCRSDGTMCNRCHHTATLQKDICVCKQPGYVFSSSGACVPCQVFGCSQCENANPMICAACGPTTSLTQEGQCECAQPSHKFTKEQTCVLCEVEGCQFCQSGEQSVCTKCTDCSAYLSEGKCYCKEGFIMNESGICEREGCPSGQYQENGDCYPCTIDNCAECSDSTTCIKCSEGKSLNEGVCQACPVGKYESDGVCIPCSTAGCLSCSSANTCLQCSSQYILRRGECTIPCQVSECLECSDPTTCLKCQRGKVLRQGICVSCEAGTFEQNGQCVSCNTATLGCLTCGQYGQCLQCSQETQLSDGQCSCRAGGTSLNVDGKCVNCHSRNCEVCGSGEEYGTITTCAVCEDEAAGPVDGKCECPKGQTMLDSKCEDCPVPLIDGECILCDQLGCKQCQNSLCRSCVDQGGAHLIDGKCECIFSFNSFNIFNIDGFCVSCVAEGCKVCENDNDPSYRCHECLDPNARPFDGICKCMDGSDIPEGGCGGVIKANLNKEGY